MLKAEYNNGIVSKNAKTQKRDITKPKLPFEVQSWALGYENELENQRLYFDDITDDSYLNKLLPFGFDYNNEYIEERRVNIREVLQKVRKTNQLKNKKPQKLQIQYLNKKNNELKQESNVDCTKKKKVSNEKKKFESISNGISRAVPGVLQQNITIERTFFNDLILLSKQRYTMKKNLDYQQKIFLHKQQQKGFMKKFVLNNAVSTKNKNIKSLEKQIEKTHEKKDDSILNKNIKLVRPASATGLRLSNSSEESFSDSKNRNNKMQANQRPKTSLPYFSQYEMKKASSTSFEQDEDKNEDPKTPLEDKRFTTLINSMSDFYKTNIQIAEQKVPTSSLRKIINKNEAFKEFKFEKFEGNGRHEIEVKRKLFEKIVNENNFNL